MRVAIAGAGAVGRSIAKELLEAGHEVLLIDKSAKAIKVYSVPRAEWLLADACEIASLDDAALERCNVVIAATGDDKVNLVVSLLAKTEYGVPRVVARINHPNNEWLFNESWGVDVAVSTPRLLSALVEEAVSVGDLVRLMTFRQSAASLVELTMPTDAPLVGERIGSIEWPADTALVAILRDGRVIVPNSDDPLEAGDELLFVTSEDVEAELGQLLAGRRRVVPAHHHDVAEQRLERLGQHPVGGRGAAQHAAQEPPRAVHAKEPDRLEHRLLPLRGHRDLGVQFGAERALPLSRAAAGLDDVDRDLLAHVVPQSVAARSGERL